MSKLGLNDHNLEVEVGGHTNPKTNRENRICEPYTYPNTKDVVHFIEMQKSEIQKVTVGKNSKQINFDTDKENLFVKLMKCNIEEVNIKLAKFMYDGFDKRLENLNTTLTLNGSDKTVLFLNCMNLIK